MVLRVPHRRRDDDGAAAVEFALIVPVLCLLLFGIISYGVMLSFRQSMSQAAAEGARAAAVTIRSGAEQANGQAAVSEALQSFGVTCSGSNLMRGTTDVGDCLVTAPGPCDPVAAGAECVKVTVTYDYKGSPLVPSFPGVGVVLPNSLSYSAQARVS